MATKTFEVELPGDVAEMVRRQIDGGVYAPVSEVVADGLRLLDERERQRQDRLAGIVRRLDQAAADPARHSSEDVRRHFERLAAEAEEKRSA